MIYINHSFHNGFFHRVFDGSTAPRMRAQYSHLPHEYDHGVPRELPGGTTLFSAVPRDTWGSQRKRPRSGIRNDYNIITANCGMLRQAGGHVKYTGNELASTLHTNSTGLYQPRPTFTLALKAFKRLNVLDSTNDSRDNTTNGVTLAVSRRALALVSLASGSARSSPGLFNWLIRLRRRTVDEDVIQEIAVTRKLKVC